MIGAGVMSRCGAGRPLVVICQHRLLHYRLPLFNKLRQACAVRGIDLRLVHGQASPREKIKNDEGQLDWADVVVNRWLAVGPVDLLWQPLPQALRRADLTLLMQENRILSNYWVWLTSWRCPGLLAFWGHGRNFQSAAPRGLRERWKAWWLLRADWWFTYTQGTRRYIAGQGFDIERITSLDNAVDDSGFLRDLSSVTDAQLEAARGNLGIGAGAQVAIFCGSLYAEKRIALLLASADLLHARLADFHLLVLGDGPDVGLVKAALPDRPWLHWLGQRRGPEKALYYRCASVMLNPGLVGLHVVDAFVAQTPLVTQASAAHSPEYDYLVDGENGLSVAADSAASYAEAVATIFTQPGLLATMQAHCARDAGRYTLERMVQNFADGIVACLDRHGRLPASATGGSQPIYPS